MREIVVDRVSYHVEIKGAGPPLLLLHGFTGSTSTWSLLSKDWSTERTCIMVDIIGHGKTAAPDERKLYEMDTVIGHLITILDTLEIAAVDVLGYSMGGRLALAFAVQYPERVRKLVLESASPGLETTAERADRRANDERLATFILEKEMSTFVDYWESIPLFATQQSLPIETKQSVRNDRLSNSPIGLANSLRYMGTGAQQSYWAQLPHLPMDVLFIVGSEDEKFRMLAKTMQKLIKNSEVIVVPNCGHAIHVENCEKFGTIVSEFLLKKNDRG